MDRQNYDQLVFLFFSCYLANSLLFKASNTFFCSAISFCRLRFSFIILWQFKFIQSELSYASGWILQLYFGAVVKYQKCYFHMRMSSNFCGTYRMPVFWQQQALRVSYEISSAQIGTVYVDMQFYKDYLRVFVMNVPNKHVYMRLESLLKYLKLYSKHIQFWWMS